MEEQAAMCSISKQGKKTNSTSSEKQVSQGVENRAKIVIVKLENDECITVDNEAQL